jgi:tetratricopeptide (TPR) repeat protein
MALSRALPLVTAIVLVVTIQNRVAQAQPADPQQLCEGPQSTVDDQVKGCSAIIDAGQVRGRELAAAYAQRGLAFTLKRNLDGAKNDLDQAIKIAPDYAPAYINRANLWTVANQPEHAMADAETALRLDPNLPLAFFVRAGAESKLGLYDRAIADYSEVLRLRPNGGATIYQPRGYAYYRKGDYDHAIADYDEVIKLGPNDAGIYLNRGDVWRAKNELPRAADDYGHAIELAPDNPGGWKGQGTIKLILHDAAGAVSDFDAAIRLNPNDSAIYLDRGAALYFQGEYPRSRTTRRRANSRLISRWLLSTAAWTCTGLATMPERSPRSSGLCNWRRAFNRRSKRCNRSERARTPRSKVQSGPPLPLTTTRCNARCRSPILRSIRNRSIESGKLAPI